MNKFSGNGANWNEFQWERELRREDRRIHCYFRELSCCLDLPGEEEMIYDQLAAHPGLVPAGSDPGHWRLWDCLDLDPEEENAAGDPRRRRKPGEELIEQLDKMAAGWNMLFALRLRDTLREEGLAVSCAAGKLLVRLSDFVDVDENTMLALKLCLGKRALHDLNDLAAMLEKIAAAQHSLAADAAGFGEALRQMRERLIDLLAGLRGRK